MLANHPSRTILLLHVLLALCSVTLAWLLRFEFTMPGRDVLLAALPVLLLMRLAGLARFRLLHGYWRYTGVSDIEDVIKAVGIGSLGFWVAERWVLGIKEFPVSIYCSEALLASGMLAGVRLFSRTLMNRIEAKHRKRDDHPPGRVLVVGAGSAAEQLIRELPRHGYTPIGCVDDDPAKQGASIHRVPVLGTVDEVPQIAARYPLDEILIALPSVTGARMRRIVEICQDSRRDFRMIPGLGDLVAGKVTVDQLRKVKLEDLLGRDPVRMDLESVRRDLAGKVVLVTGAAGSIGSELCRQILGYGPAQLICLDQAETPLFYLQLELAKHRPKSRARYFVADICDTHNVRQLLVEHGVQIIFHAAAYKHVPLMEVNLREALKNNVFALRSLLDAAEKSGCEDFLLISSDKAVHPTSFMGCTKRLGELIVAARPASAMRCRSVRFGNVLGSQGSVVPIFQEQIRTTKRLTITHPEITRYFMTIPEAVSLVLQAYTMGQHGDVLVLDMGEPLRIVDLAKTLVRLSGKSEEEIEIVFTGLRPGEKLYEELFYHSEKPLPTPNEKVKRTRSHLIHWPKLAQHLNDLYILAETRAEPSIRAKVRDIIPEYNYEPELSSSDRGAPSELVPIPHRGRAYAHKAAG